MSFSSLLKAGNVAVVTGASSGIGRAASLFFAEKGLDVWMVDIDAEELALAKDLVQSNASNATIYKEVIDVSDTASVAALSERVFSVSRKVNILMNNAAVHAVSEATSSLDDVASLQKVVSINTFGPINGCVAFIPKMQETKEEGYVINTGSKQGITMPPGNCPYNVSKAALKCYTEALEHDLRNTKDGKIRAALLVPGWVNTSIHLKFFKALARQKEEELDMSKVFFSEDKPQGGAWMPRQVIEFMAAELDKGRFYIICPDNDVDRETDNLRMTWTMQDITEDRVPLSRWHPTYKDKFTAYLEANKKK